MIEIKSRYSDRDLQDFADTLQELSHQIGFKVSARGWAYIMEQRRMINKDQFDKVNTLINTCRKKGYLPINFVAEDSAREFQGVEKFDGDDVYKRAMNWLRWSLEVDEDLDMSWWENEEYYIQMVVEKVDLVTLFAPVCERYKIPIANSKGWSSMLQRATYARRFKEAERRGLECVLLYFGDHDPDGLRISEFLRKNLKDVSHVTWSDGTSGYNPKNLIIERFGLNYEFIENHTLTWIDNLITGGGKNLASPNHRNYRMEYVQEYLTEVGERKCEANAIVVLPDLARRECHKAIQKYLGEDALERFDTKRDEIVREFSDFKDEHHLEDKVKDIIRIIDENRPQ